MKRRLPSLKSLRVFESVARNRSFRKAADELCVTHSAVSHQIKLLEDELGFFLFDRSGRTIALTSEGETLYPVVNDSFANIMDVVEDLKNRNQVKTLNVQTYVTFGTVWLIPRLNDFQKKHPDIQVRISISFVDVDFDKDDVDVGIIMGQESWSHWVYDYLFNLDIFPVCSRKLKESGNLDTLEDLAKHQLVNVELAPEDWISWLREAGLEESLAEEGPVVDNYLQSLDLVYDEGAIVMGREPFARRALTQGSLTRAFDISVPESGSWYLVYPKQRNAKPEIELFRDWLIEQVKQDPGMYRN